MQYLQKILIRIYTSNSIGFKGIFTASIVLLQNCFGPGEKSAVFALSTSWARRKYTIFALSTFGPGEKTQYLH